MTTNNDVELQHRILQFLERYPTEQFKSKELARRLGIRDESTYQQFKQELRFLQDKGALLRYRGKKYGYRYVPEVVQGTLRLVKTGGVVAILDSDVEVFIEESDIDSAYDGDTVEVTLYPQSTKQKVRDKIRKGKVTRVLEHSSRTVVGILEKVRKQYRVIPDSKNLTQEIFIQSNELLGAHAGDKVVVEIVPKNKSHALPEGKVIEVIGKAGALSTELQSVAREFHLPLEFPPEVIHEADTLSSAIPQDEIHRRQDFRNLLTFTIDPEDAKDFDDALSIELLPDGNYLLGVHIADVSYYVREGSALDIEALKRGTSVYFPNGVIPMLPERLSGNLCSLRPNEDRLAYSVSMVVSPRGAVKEYKIEQSIIQSKRRFTYEEVEELIKQDKKGNKLSQKDAPFISSLKMLYKLSNVLTKNRLRKGSIDFETAEVRFRFDETGKPSEVEKKIRLESHRLVEECMLLANRVVARHIGLPKPEQQVQPFLYRVHDAPDPQRIQELALFVKKFGFSLNVEGGVSSKELQQLLNQVKGSEVENVINGIVLRSMAKAIYSDHNIGHYGLAFDYYAHFTSPIRRYPDLIVHRMLKRYSGGIAPSVREELRRRLPAIAKQSSDRERLAMEAERTAIKVVQIEYMKDHLGDEFQAVISGVAPYGIFVELNDSLAEGLIHVRDMMDDYYGYNEKQYALVGRRTKNIYRLGDAVTVKLVRVNPEQRQLDFMLVSKE